MRVVSGKEMLIVVITYVAGYSGKRVVLLLVMGNSLMYTPARRVASQGRSIFCVVVVTVALLAASCAVVETSQRKTGRCSFSQNTSGGY